MKNNEEHPDDLYPDLDAKPESALDERLRRPLAEAHQGE